MLKPGLYFVSPDKGSLLGPAEDYRIATVCEIDESINRRANTNWAHTFHGRNVYSYIGARLAAGVISFAEVEPLLPAQVMQLDALWFTDMEQSMPLDALVSFTGPLLVLHGDSDTGVTTKETNAIYVSLQTCWRVRIGQFSVGIT